MIHKVKKIIIIYPILYFIFYSCNYFYFINSNNKLKANLEKQIKNLEQEISYYGNKFIKLNFNQKQLNDFLWNMHENAIFNKKGTILNYGVISWINNNQTFSPIQSKHKKYINNHHKFNFIINKGRQDDVIVMKYPIQHKNKGTIVFTTEVNQLIRYMLNERDFTNYKYTLDEENNLPIFKISLEGKNLNTTILITFDKDKINFKIKNENISKTIPLKAYFLLLLVSLSILYLYDLIYNYSNKIKKYKIKIKNLKSSYSELKKENLRLIEKIDETNKKFLENKNSIQLYNILGSKIKQSLDKKINTIKLLSLESLTNDLSIDQHNSKEILFCLNQLSNNNFDNKYPELTNINEIINNIIEITSYYASIKKIELIYNNTNENNDIYTFPNTLLIIIGALIFRSIDSSSKNEKIFIKLKQNLNKNEMLISIEDSAFNIKSSIVNNHNKYIPPFFTYDNKKISALVEVIRGDLNIVSGKKIGNKIELSLFSPAQIKVEESSNVKKIF